MNEQFFYKRKVEEKQGEELVTSYVVDSFNINRVLRTISQNEGTRLVVLDDFHVRKQEVPIFNKKREITGYKNQEQTVNSEIELLPEDAERFVKLYSK